MDLADLASPRADEPGDTEATHVGRDRVSTTKVATPRGDTSACSVGAPLSQALAVAAFNARQKEEQ